RALWKKPVGKKEVKNSIHCNTAGPGDGSALNSKFFCEQPKCSQINRQLRHDNFCRDIRPASALNQHKRQLSQGIHKNARRNPTKHRRSIFSERAPKPPAQEFGGKRNDDKNNGENSQEYI